MNGDKIAEYCDEVHPSYNPSSRYMLLYIEETTRVTAQRLESGIIEVIDV